MARAHCKNVFFLCFSLLLLSGCKATVPIEMKMALPGINTDTSNAQSTSDVDNRFYYNGFPTNLRRRNDGTIDLSDFPRRWHHLTDLYVSEIERRRHGYPLIGPIYLPFSGPVSMRALPGNDADFASADSPIQVVDIDPQSAEYGRRFPLHVTMTRKADSYRPRFLLQLLPTLGIDLRPNTTYAAIVTNQIPIAQGSVLTQNAQLAAVLDPDHSDLQADPAALDVYAPLRNYLQDKNIASATIMAATVWTTGDPGHTLRETAAHMAATSEQLPTLPVSNIRHAEDYPEYCIIKGTIDVPSYQLGTPPYRVSGGEIQWDSNGHPVQQGVRHAPFVVTIPRNVVMPAQGFPVMNYIHGAGGSSNQLYDRGQFQYLDFSQPPYYIGKAGAGPAQIAAQRGWAGASLSGHLSMDELGVKMGWLQGVYDYNIFNPIALMNSDYQMVWEQIFFRRVLAQLRLDPSLCPDADPGTNATAFKLNTNMEVSMGQSQGNWINTLLGATDPQPYPGLIMSGMGGTWIKTFTAGAGYRLMMSAGAVNLLPGEYLDDAHPFLMLAEWLMNGADAAVHAESLLRYPAKTPPNIIAFSGILDYGNPEPAQRPLLMAVGVDLAGDDLGENYNSTLFPYLAIGGERQLPYPVINNIDVPGYGLRTAVVTRYRDNNPFSLYNGHEITYQLPAIKHQYGCFLQQIGEGRVPLVNVGYVQNGPCQ